MPSNELEDILRFGRSNTHPLRLQLIAIPPNTELALHVHPAIELDIPLIGELHERRSDILIPSNSLTRLPEHAIGTPLSNFSEEPTREELQIVAESLSERVVLEDSGSKGVFQTNTIGPGESLVNQVGSVHQSFTSSDSPCLLLVLGPNVHGHFMPGNFHQREGIEDLTGIDDLLVD